MELKWDWGIANGAETPHVFLMRGDEKYLSLPMTPQNSEKVEELAKLLNTSDDLYYAMKAMLVGSDKTLPEAFPGHTEAYMNTVGRPRALQETAKWEEAHGIPAHHRYGAPPPR